jgi:hypothetical protein
MSYFFLILIWCSGTGLAWRRIFSRRYSWLIRAAALGFTLVPVFGPIFYLMIDSPESSPPGVSPEEFWQPAKGAGRPWPAYDPLIKSLRKIFTGTADEDD